MSRRSNEDWRRDVFRAPAEVLPAAVKVLCLYLADHMRPSGFVSVPRGQMATDLGCHKARVAERLAKAVEAEYLHRVSPGYTNRTAEYGRSWPDSKSVQQSGNQSAGERPAKADPLAVQQSGNQSTGEGTALQDATTRADLSAVGADRDVGNKGTGVSMARLRGLPAGLHRSPVHPQEDRMTATVIPFKARAVTTACQCPRHHSTRWPIACVACWPRERLASHPADGPRAGTGRPHRDHRATGPADRKDKPVTIKISDTPPKRTDRKPCLDSKPARPAAGATNGYVVAAAASLAPQPRPGLPMPSRGGGHTS